LHFLEWSLFQNNIKRYLILLDIVYTIEIDVNYLIVQRWCISKN
jgi:hypothetical protein